MDPEHNTEYVKHLEAILANPTSRTNVLNELALIYGLGLRLGRTLGQGEGYRRARNMYKKRRPSITEMAHEEFRVSLEELRRNRNRSNAHRSDQNLKQTELSNGRIVALIDLLRSEIDEAIRQRDALMGLTPQEE